MNDQDAIDELCAAYDAEDATPLPRDLYDDRNREDGHKAPQTLAAWRERLSTAAKGLTLTEATAEDINAYTSDLVASDDGPSASRVQDIENSLRKFYRYHDLGVDPADITVHDADTEPWTDKDLLTADERKALRNAATNPRDKCVFHMLIYTGLRNKALRTLRVKDIDLDEHVWYFNNAASGLKGIHEPRSPRPLFQAERAVREWILDFHPTGDRDDYLIAPHSGRGRSKDNGGPMSGQTVNATMDRLKDRAGVDKPCHPHMMRHNFVSMCRKHPEISDADIKFYLGHAPESNVMESTYSHLSSGDHNAAGHTAFGVQDAAEEQDDLDPWDTTCGRCDRVLAPSQSVCEACETPRGETPWDVAPVGEPDRIEQLEATVEKLSKALGVEPGG